MDTSKLEELLKAETYPHSYIHKFIGTKSPAFLAAVAQLETAFPRASRSKERESKDTGGKVYLALTYVLEAGSPAEIIELIKATSALPDLKIIL